MKRLLSKAYIAGYTIRLSEVSSGYQVDYGADSQTFSKFTEATQAYMLALNHAGALEGLTDEEDME